MPRDPMQSYAASVEPAKLSSPRIFLFRMLVFLTLCSLVLVVIYKQIWLAFLANPALNGVIIAVLAIGIILAFRQVIRLYPEIRWVNNSASPIRASRSIAVRRCLHPWPCSSATAPDAP